MTEHIRGRHSKTDEVRTYIKAALKLHGKQSLHQISLLTGFHFNTVRGHVLHLISEGAIVRVQKEEYEYVLAKGKELPL